VVTGALNCSDPPAATFTVAGGVDTTALGGGGSEGVRSEVVMLRADERGEARGVGSEMSKATTWYR
jgi:hypothetical protein